METMQSIASNGIIKRHDPRHIVRLCENVQPHAAETALRSSSLGALKKPT